MGSEGKNLTQGQLLIAEAILTLREEVRKRRLNKDVKTKET